MVTGVKEKSNAPVLQRLQQIPDEAYDNTRKSTGEEAYGGGEGGGRLRTVAGIV